MFIGKGKRLALVIAFILPWQNTIAQQFGYHGFTPLVLSENSPSQVKFTVEVIGKDYQVSLDFNPGWDGIYTTGQIGTIIKLRDDGTAGDEIAGDNIYSALLSKSKILSARRTDDVNRVFIGYLDLNSGEDLILRANIFANVYTEEQGIWPVTQISPTVQMTSNLVNIHLSSFFQASSVLSDVTEEFYRWFRDDYDFLNIVYGQNLFEANYYLSIKNEVDGIGRDPLDATSAYGSAGHLQGILQFPVSGHFDGAANSYIKTLAQQWINYLNYFPLNQGAPFWPYSSMGSGVMGVHFGRTFACNIVEKEGKIWLNPRSDALIFNDLDLYLMGLLPPEEVRTQYIFDDQKEAQALECKGQVYTGSITPLAVEDVIDRVGKRIPSADVAPTQFRVATILVTRDGLATPEEMSFYSWFAERAELKTPVATHSGFAKELSNPFYVATGGRVTLDASISLDDEPLSISGTPSGSLSNRSLSVNIRPPRVEVGTTRQIFVAALNKDNWYFLTSAGWQAWAGGIFPVYDSQEMNAEFKIQVLDGGIDLSGVVGTKIYVGYGIDESEMLASSRYVMVHMIQ